MSQATVPGGIAFDFTNRVAVVTGAGSGVGEGIVRGLHAGGAKVVDTDMNPAFAEGVAKDLDASGETAFALELDVRSKDHFLRALDQTTARWGKVDVLVNNAGWGKRTPVDDITPEEFDDVSAVNMRSVFLACQVFAKSMVKAGYGRIVNITSLSGQNGGTVASAHYAASKAGAIMLTKYFARDLAGTGVVVNGIAPGPIDTAKARLTAEQIAAVEARVPVGRFMHVEEIASAALLLASEQAGFCVGATLDMNGGLYLR